MTNWKMLNEVLQGPLSTCGCGDPEVVLQMHRRVLLVLKKRTEETRAVPLPLLDPALVNWDEVHNRHVKQDEDLAAAIGAARESPLWYLEMYLLDHAGLIDHGTNICGSWISPKGEELLAAFATAETKFGGNYLERIAEVSDNVVFNGDAPPWP